ncbi:MAG: Ig-like domain-containing protein, partial [Campylobacteraceae bacterium]|nr:Ig-like domain-containing protein [Campylobacteraceae bacterium]
MKYVIYASKFLNFLLISLLFISCGNHDQDDPNTPNNPNNFNISHIQVSPSFISLKINDKKILTVYGVSKDNSVYTLHNEDIKFTIDKSDIASINKKGELEGLNAGNATIKASYNDLSPLTIRVTVSEELNTSNINSAYFGNLYVDTIPEDSSLEKYDERLFAMMTGRVLDKDNKPLKDVTVAIHNFNEYGSVKTDENGSYALPVEGGKNIIVRYQKAGFTTIDRDIYAKTQDWSILPDVNMLKKDTKVSVINLNNSSVQTHVSSKIGDERGARSATIVFEGVNKAKAVDKDGNERELESINVRATEFEVPASMPSNLPDTVAFTYCIDVTVDGISDDESVVFDEPIAMYVDNFLGFNVGEIVPVGYYDRNKGEWIGSENGIVIRLLDINGDGIIDALDSNNDGEPDDLNDDGDFSDEVAGLQDNINYQAGQTYMRARITHFTPWDLNFGMAPPLDANSPEESNTDNDPKGDCKIPTNSYITAKTQVLHEDIDIAGTDIKLHYSSKNTNGYKNTISAIVDTTNMASSAFEADAILEIAGKRYEKKLNRGEINNIEFEWDGRDMLGNKLSGVIDGTITVRYKYKMIYYAASKNYEIAWGKIGTNPTGIEGIDNIAYQSVQSISVSANRNNDENNLANGWSIEDDLYMNLSPKGILSNAETLKYIEVKDGMLFAVDKEPENRFNGSLFRDNVYYGLTLTRPLPSFYSNQNRVNLIVINFREYKDYKSAYYSNRILYEYKDIGSYSELGLYIAPEAEYPVININNYDYNAYYKGTIFEGIQEYSYAYLSYPKDLKNKIRQGVESNQSYYFTTSSAGAFGGGPAFWVSLPSTELLYKKVNDVLIPDYDYSLTDNPAFSFLNLKKTDIVIFNSNLGYVYDASTGVLKQIFDNTIKQTIRTYEHD